VKSVDWNSFRDLVAQFLIGADSSIEKETNLEEAGLESLSLVELVAEIETQLGVEFPADMLNWDTFASAGTLFDATVSLMGDRV
jgi:acyl carrier protein